MAWLAHVAAAIPALIGLLFLGAIISILVIGLLLYGSLAGIGLLIGGRYLFDRLGGKKKNNGRSDRSTEQGRQLRTRMRRAAKPTLLLVPTKDPVFSKLGGQPELASSLAWPFQDGAPRSFVAQIDLEELRDAGGPDWLPAEGRIYAFKDSEGFGRADDTVVLISTDPAGDEIKPPAALARRHVFAERRVGFMAMKSVPSLDWLNINLPSLEVSPAELDKLSNAPAEPFGDELQHRIGGYPAEIQDGQMQVECEFLARGLTRDYREPVPDAIARASKQWRLLLQIDSDPALGMNWGDAGRLYVFIKERHARAGDFSKTVSLWQTY